MNCTHVFKSGKRKGKSCGKEIDNKSTFCTKHVPVLTTNPPRFLDTLDDLQFKLLALDTTLENKTVIIKKFRYLETLSTSSTEYQKNLNWLRHALAFPYNKMAKIPIAIKAGDSMVDGNLDYSQKDIQKYVTSVYSKLDDYIYGMHDVKEEIMSFVCKRISNPSSTDHVLALKGHNGIGKTRLAYGLAKVLDLPIKTINLGSVNDVSYFTGHHFTFMESLPGKIVEILNATQCKNSIIYFDELDKIHQTDKGQSIYSFLTHLIDPTQNSKFQDVYLSGLELDVSQVLFIFSFNDENLIDPTVKDRLKTITIKEPSADDKVNIAQKFIIPEICSNINYKVDIDIDIIERIVRFDNSRSGLRGVRRILEDVISKLNVVRMLDEQNQNRLSFYNVSKEQMIDNIINKHNAQDDVHHHSMYC